jgi:putative methanogenesis marker protein 8
MVQEKDEHIVEAVGKCRIVIRDGRVVDISAPIISDCPLAKKFAVPVTEITTTAVKKNIEHRIRTFGMCTPQRDVLEETDFVGFGASELLSSAIRTGMLDAVVLACDGAGTVVATTSPMAQGIGGRMSGLVRTSPFLEVIRRIEKNHGIVLDPVHAGIDQPAGVALATERGLCRIAVTVAGPDDAEKIRAFYPDVVIFAVHTSGLTAPEAERLVSVCDIVTACASAPLRAAAAKVALVQAGTAIPVFGLTDKGKAIIINKLQDSTGPILVKFSKLPVLSENHPRPLI